MRVYARPSPSDCWRWEQLVRQGFSPGDAARSLGFAGSSTFRRADREKHHEVLTMWRERRDAAAGVKAQPLT